MAKKVVEEKVEVKTPIVETHVEEIVESVIPIKVEKSDSENIFKMIDSLQTIEMGRLELAKELIKKSEYLEAITLLKSIQTLESGKMAEIISKL
jgi:hypothetical protein